VIVGLNMTLFPLHQKLRIYETQRR